MNFGCGFGFAFECGFGYGLGPPIVSGAANVGGWADVIETIKHQLRRLVGGGDDLVPFLAT